VVHQQVPDAQLWIVGQEMTPGYAAELAATAERLGIGDHVTFTGRRNDVAQLMAGADIFAMPSFEEPFGLVFTEAMAMQLPVVALRSGGAPEIIEHERSGLLSEPGDVDTLANHLLRLIGDPAARRTMGAYGREVVQRRFTIERMAADMAHAYALIASNAGTTGADGE
jgi:glycosyltransferase involved in cell wall biosynthesis